MIKQGLGLAMLLLCGMASAQDVVANIDDFAVYRLCRCEQDMEIWYMRA
ncbi:hypothetical protein [Acinetobacter sp. c3-l95]